MDNTLISKQLFHDLSEMGVKAGMTVFVHSSLKGLHTPKLSPADVIEVLTDLLQPDGTLMMPGFTYANVTRQAPFFSCRDTVSCVGIIPETFRKMPQVRRSLNPVHSVCAIGRFSKELLCEHLLDDVSIGEHSPLLKLPAYDGKILMLGCGLTPNTFMHGVENTALAPYRAIRYWVDYQIKDMDGNIFPYKGGLADMTHVAQRYDRIEELMTSPSLIHGKVLNGDAWLIDAAALLAAGRAAINSNPFFFVDMLDDFKY